MGSPPACLVTVLNENLSLVWLTLWWSFCVSDDMRRFVEAFPEFRALSGECDLASPILNVHPQQFSPLTLVGLVVGFVVCAGNVSKHVAVVTELSRQSTQLMLTAAASLSWPDGFCDLLSAVDMRNLLDVSKLEQEIACNGDHAPILDVCASPSHLSCLILRCGVLRCFVRRQNMLKFLDDAKVNWNDKLRLVMLYAIRYVVIVSLPFCCASENLVR